MLHNSFHPDPADDFLHRPAIRPPQPLSIMPLGHPRNQPRSSPPPPDHPANRSYIPQLIPHGVDPAKVDSKMFYSYVPNTIKSRKRTSPTQLRRLEAIFVDDKKPNNALRKSLAEELGMSAREVQVWFQNRRAKEKKGGATKVEAAAATASPSTAPAESTSEPTSPATPSAELSASETTTKLEHNSPDAPPASPSASWAPTPLPAPLAGPPALPHLDLPVRSSPPEASPAAYDTRRSSLPVLSPYLLPDFSGTAFHAPPSPYHRRSVATLEKHPSQIGFTRASGPVRASLSEGTFARYAPFPARRPNFEHRASVPAAMYNTRPLLAGFAQPQHAPLDGGVMWTNLDPFGTGQGHAQLPETPLPESGYSFGMPSADAVVPDHAYEFPARKALELEARWDPDARGGVPHMGMAYRRSEGSIGSLGYSDTSASAGTGPYFSDVTSEDGDGRRGSCASTSDMLSGLRVDEYRHADGPGSDYAASEHGTLTYPSPTATLDDRDGERDHTAPPAATYASSSELALALSHSHSGSPESTVQEHHYPPPDMPPPSASGLPTFKFPDVEHQPSPQSHSLAYGDYATPVPQTPYSPHDADAFSGDLYAQQPQQQQRYPAYAPEYGGNTGEQYPPDGYPMVRYHSG